jgi:hypothetical protein
LGESQLKAEKREKTTIAPLQASYTEQARKCFPHKDEKRQLDGSAKPGTRDNPAITHI